MKLDPVFRHTDDCRSWSTDTDRSYLSWRFRFQMLWRAGHTANDEGKAERVFLVAGTLYLDQHIEDILVG